MSDDAVTNYIEVTSKETLEIYLQNSRKSAHVKYLVNLFVNFYITYFCLVDIRLKRDTLRSFPFETILEWELILGKNGQLVRNNNIHVGIVNVLFMCCRCF